MEVLIILGIIVALAIFDVIALRFGTDSRVMDNSRPNWW